MALSRLAQQFADEIKLQDWSDAPYRADRAGHRREFDTKSHQTPQLAANGTENVLVNVMWVTAQVLGYNDPNFDVYEYASACGLGERQANGYRWGASIAAGMRGGPGTYDEPGKL